MSSLEAKIARYFVKIGYDSALSIEQEISMSSTPQDAATEHARDIRSALLRDIPANPALQRLQGRILAQAEASEVITSYDRMHHRHSRS